MVGPNKPRLNDGRTSQKSSSSGRSTRSESVAPSMAPSAVSPRSGRGGYDGNRDTGEDVIARRDPNKQRTTIEPKNFDLGMAGWATVRQNEIVGTLPARPPPSKLGQAVKISLNNFHVTAFPTVQVYQYDIIIGNGVEKRGIIRKVFNSKAVKDAVGDGFIFDGNKLGWSGKKIERELRLTVDLDAEQGKKPRDKPDVHRIVIRMTNVVAFQTLLAHLQGKASFDNKCLETINFADHLLRQTPTQKFTAIKRAFFSKGDQRFELGGGVEAFKGVYQSLRLVHPGRLSINVDVANAAFWQPMMFCTAAALSCGCRDPVDLSTSIKKGGGEKSRAGKELKKMRKLHVLARHRDKPTPDEYVVEKFIWQSSREYKIQIFDQATGKEIEKTVFDYYRDKYDFPLKHPDLPLLKMTRGKNTVLPMECVSIKNNQRYMYKMDERQTSNMIKFAVTSPPQRFTDIQHGLKMVDWNNDPVLKKYGLKVDLNRTTVEGRLLPAPTVKFGQGEAKPGTSGRWDLKGKKFLQSNPASLKSWAVCVISGRRGGKPDKTVIEQFIQAFIQGYVAHGGRVENRQPTMSLAQGEDVGAWVTATWNAAGNQSQMRPQILVFVLPDKDSNVYGRIKRSCECRYGVVSQCVQYAHAMKKQPQYISNVCMKFNAKLGGITCQAVGPKTAKGHFSVPTMVIGADVSHAAPGIQAPSMAAMTVSMDKLATRYAALCQTNGYRVEMINTDIINNDLKPMLTHWIQNLGGGRVPQVVLYLRDGVSEGQYNHVLQQEVNDLKTLIKDTDPNSNTKFVVLVGSKRHHVRFFPERGDRNGNAFPGTLIETGATNIFENDFYLQSHAAIKGTARPTHYYVLMNEANMSNEQLHILLYEQSYQYIRATTPVSIHPAIYYAHLASNRAIPHDPKWAGSSDTSSTLGPAGESRGYKKAGQSGSSSGLPAEYDKLMPMPNQGGINTSMWYI